jgi:hypothetical protein
MSHFQEVGMRVKAASMYISYCILLVSLSINVPAQARRAIDTKAKASLRGLEAVALVIETTPAAEQNGITKARINTDVQLRLSKAGIRILTMDEVLTTVGKPTVYIDLWFSREPRGYTFSLDLQFREEVIPTRRPSARVTAATWSNCMQGIFREVNPEGAPQMVVDGILSVVDWFLKDYQAANSK